MKIRKLNLTIEEPSPMVKELIKYLDSIDIHSNNIGDIRRACFVPWDSEWNGFVRNETAKRERLAGPVADCNTRAAAP